MKMLITGPGTAALVQYLASNAGNQCACLAYSYAAFARCYCRRRAWWCLDTCLWKAWAISREILR